MTKSAIRLTPDGWLRRMPPSRGARATTMTTDLGRRLLRDMIRIRRTEETIADLYPSQEMRTPTHFSIGQEAVAVGVCAALGRDDVDLQRAPLPRPLPRQGRRPRRMVAELYGKETGCARGRGGSVHLSDPAAGVLASSAILGQTMAVAVGTALAFAMDGLARVAASFFGDGTVEEGIFHETLNFAVMKRVPVLFVCENNGYSTHTRLEVRQPAGVPIHARARRLRDARAPRGRQRRLRGVRGRPRGGGAAAAAATGRPSSSARPTGGASTWGHSGTTTRDTGRKAEVDAWIARCPIRRATARLVAEGACTAAEVEAMDAREPGRGGSRGGRRQGGAVPAVEDLTLGTY